MSYYYDAILEREAMRYKKLHSSSKPLNSKQSWNNNSYGSSECAYCSMSSIMEAYSEYRNNNNW